MYHHITTLNNWFINVLYIYTILCSYYSKQTLSGAIKTTLNTHHNEMKRGKEGKHSV